MTIARKIDIVNGKAQVERVIPDGFDLIEISLPALVTLSNEHAVPRYPNVKGIMLAKRKEPIIWKPADIGAAPAKIGAAGSRSQLLKLFQPVRYSKCEIVVADTPEEAAAKLAVRLHGARVL